MAEHFGVMGGDCFFFLSFGTTHLPVPFPTRLILHLGVDCNCCPTFLNSQSPLLFLRISLTARRYLFFVAWNTIAPATNQAASRRNGCRKNHATLGLAVDARVGWAKRCVGTVGGS